jgi:hypothetical protein
MRSERLGLPFGDDHVPRPASRHHQPCSIRSLDVGTSEERWIAPLLATCPAGEHSCYGAVSRWHCPGSSQLSGCRIASWQDPADLLRPDARSAVGRSAIISDARTCVLHGLGTYEQLVEQALPLERYVLANGSGQVLQSFDLSVLTGEVGPLLMIGRADLVRLLESSCADADIRRGVTVTSIVQDAAAAEVSVDDGNTERFDVVVACDGIESPTRQLVFGPAQGYDSGWVLWTWWADATRSEPADCGGGGLERHAGFGGPGRRAVTCRRSIGPIGPRVVRKTVPKGHRTKSDRLTTPGSRDVCRTSTPCMGSRPAGSSLSSKEGSERDRRQRP